jgi:oxalate decarboxylase/phosphoglucose isomerase-like protein (cupin superfamily)
MKSYNIYSSVTEAGLGSFQDERGTIHDIFYAANMNHACIITNQPGAIRGNHYHKFTTQYTYILSGTLTYYSKIVGDDEPAQAFTAVPGDMIISEPYEIHAMMSGAAGCAFIAFAEGPRGGEDYETDTYRVENIIGV